MEVFDRFESEFAQTATAGSSIPWLGDQLGSIPGYGEFSRRWAGATFEGGLYRVVDGTTGPKMAELAVETFPDFEGRAHPFAYDWLGRSFAIDLGRIGNHQPMILMLEPGTGEALEIPYSFLTFHENLADLRDPALASGFFSEWRRMNPLTPPLALSDCVGYKVPLFLGGMDTVENLEVVDIDVYWTLCGQLRHGTRQLPPGSTVRDLSI